MTLCLLFGVAITLTSPVLQDPGGGEKGIDDSINALTTTVFAPNPTPGAKFGSAIVLTDFQGDSGREIVVGAEGEGVVYVFEPSGRKFEATAAYQAQGKVTGGKQPDVGSFGAALAAANLDGDAKAEVFVGAPGAQVDQGRVFVLGLGPDPLVLVPEPGEIGFFGKAIATGDFNGDGELDVAIGASTAQVGDVAAGIVSIRYGPFGEGEGERFTLANPAPVDKGFFGHALAAGDWDGDGKTDLVVSAVGNTVDGAASAGEIYVYSGPVQAGEFTVLHDPAPVEGDLPRFGMHITQRGNAIAVGSPRKDHKGLLDCGLAATFRAGAQDAVLHEHPLPFEKALTGFRVLLVDWMGDATLDLAVVSLPIMAKTEGEEIPNRGLWIWDGAKAGTPQHLPAVAGSSDHFPQGAAVGQLLPGGREEILLGDHLFDRAGQGKADDIGRIVIYSAPK